jgi:hypothetical protein
MREPWGYMGPNSRRHIFGRAGGVDHHTTPGFSGRDLQERLLEVAMKDLSLGFKPALPGHPGGRAGETDRHGKVQDKGQIGPQRPKDSLLKSRDDIGGHAAGGALIGAGRISESVTNHNHPRRERWDDDAFDMVASGGIHQKGFGQGRPAINFTGHEKATNRFGSRRSAGLARDEDLTPSAPKPLGQTRDLSGLAGPLPALKGNEKTTRHRGSGWP